MAFILRLFLLLLSFTIVVQNTSGQTIEKEEYFRQQLERADMILPVNPKNTENFYSVVRAYQILAQLTHLSPVCGIDSVSLTPQKCNREYINLFAIEFPSDDVLSSDISENDRRYFEALENNCLVIGSTIFCDYNYLRRQMKLARLLYLNYFMTRDTSHFDTLFRQDTTEEIKKLREFIPTNPYFIFPPLDKETLVQLAETQLDRRYKPSELYEPDYIENDFGYLKERYSMIIETMEVAVLSLIIGHEYSHIEQNICKALKITDIYEQRPLIGAATKLDSVLKTSHFVENYGMLNIIMDNFKEEYITLTSCLEDDEKEDFFENILDRDEFYADVNATVYVKYILDFYTSVQNLLYLVNQKEEFDSGLYYDSIQLDALRDAYNLVTYTIIRAAEYEFIFGGDPSNERLRDIKNEPYHNKISKISFQDHFHYYSKLEMQRTEAELYKGAGQHIDETIKLILVLEQLKTMYKMFGYDDTFLLGSGRVLGHIHGRLVGIQKNNGVSIEKAELVARNKINTLFPLMMVLSKH